MAVVKQTVGGTLDRVNPKTGALTRINPNTGKPKAPKPKAGAVNAAMQARYNQPYDAMSPPFPTYQSMINEANRRSVNDVNAAISGLVTPGALNARREAEVRDISALTTAATGGMQNIYNQAMTRVGQMPMQQAAAQAQSAPTANAAITGAGVGTSEAPNPAANAVAAAMAQNQAQGLLGNVTAVTARGPAEQLASRRRMEEGLSQRDAEVAKIQATRPSINAEYLEKLRGEMFQAQTAKSNLGMAQRQQNLDEAYRRASLGEQARQFDVSTAQNAKQFAEQQGLNWAQLSQQDKQHQQDLFAAQQEADAKAGADQAKQNWRNTGVPQGVFQGAIGFAQDQVINATGKTRQAGAGEPVMEYTYLVTVPKHLNAQGLMVPAASHTVTTSSKIPDKLRPQGDKKGKTESWKLTGSVQKGTSSGGELVSDAPSFPNLVAQVAATLRTRGVNASVSRGLAWDLVSQYYNQLVPYDNPAYGTGTNMQGMVGPDSYPQQPYGNLFSW